MENELITDFYSAKTCNLLSKVSGSLEVVYDSPGTEFARVIIGAFDEARIVTSQLDWHVEDAETLNETKWLTLREIQEQVFEMWGERFVEVFCYSPLFECSFSYGNYRDSEWLLKSKGVGYC